MCGTHGNGPIGATGPVGGIRPSFEEMQANAERWFRYEKSWPGRAIQRCQKLLDRCTVFLMRFY